jgi:8-oxo-dGTP diphosphatase
LIYTTIQELYQKRNEENQERTEKALNILNFLLGAGILADLGGVLMIALSLTEQNPIAIILHSIIAIAISGVLVLAIIYYLYVKVKIKQETIKRAVDAVILDEGEKILLIKRKFPPFKDFYALPGGAIDKGENPEEALLREVKEETNLNIEIIRKIGIFDDPNRDPRGEVHSIAYLCKIVGKNQKAESGSDAKEAIFFPIKDIDNFELAFDHEKMIKKALKQ